MRTLQIRKMVAHFIANPEVRAFNGNLGISSDLVIELFFQCPVAPEPSSCDYATFLVAIYYPGVLDVLIELNRNRLRSLRDNGMRAPRCYQGNGYANRNQ